MENNEMICFSNYVNAKPRAKLKDIKELVEKLPNSSLTQNGEDLKVTISNEDGSYSTLELVESKIIFNYYSKRLGREEKGKCILKFLEILKSLGGLYEIGINPLCNQLIDLILASQLSSKENKLDKEPFEDLKLRELGESNSILAIELRKLNAKNEKFGKENRTLKHFCSDVINSVAGKEDASGRKVAGALNSFGIEENLTENIISILAKDD